MGWFSKGQTGAGATMPSQEGSEYEVAHSSTPTYAASEGGPQKWADHRDYKYAHGPPSLSSVAAESTASLPNQNNNPYSSSGLDANSAAGRLRQGDQSEFSRSTDQISVQSKASFSSHRSASTKPKEPRNYKQYHIPIRAEVPSPASNPRNTPTSHLMAPSLVGGDETPTGIGMALGSPSHAPGPADLRWQTGTLTTVTSGGHAQEPASNPNGVSRSMSKRWNPFSRTKSKRTKPVDTLPSQSLGSESGKSVVDLANGAKNADDFGSGKKRSEKESDIRGTGPVLRKDSSSSVSKSPPKDISGLPNQRNYAAPTRYAPVPPQPQLQPSKLLEVDIPTTQMERFSVMFGTILKKQPSEYQYFLQQAQQSWQPQPSAAPEQDEKPQESRKPEETQQSQPKQTPEQSRRPSKESVKTQDSQQVLSPLRPQLSVRRQVKLDKLKVPAAKTFQDTSIPIEIIVPQRRSTSPLPKSSPSFSLFPQDQAPANTLPLRVSSRARSNTSPAMVNFPTPAMYKATKGLRKRTTSVSNPSQDEPLPTDSQITPERREKLISKFHRKESTSSEASVPRVAGQLSESPASITAPVAIPAPVQPRSILKKPSGPPPQPLNRAAEPKPPSSQRASPAQRISPSQKVSPTQKPSPSQRVAPPKHQHQKSTTSIRTNADEEEVERALYEAVEISIARQISVSRQQRNIVVPLMRSASKRVPGEAAAEVAALIKPEKNKRMVETRTATPQLVHPEEEGNIGQSGYRKSSRVVLEGA
ncbi:hypothetical protein TGAMA5MH_09428 [Trichoderma gamsii]|uniref:Uncharacterized protein n=1 Tax=Trichoderma gamsii TaxID=398673 RepID=A0A2K0SZJ8_9HYPO|nr:hypothetical protein TGAMA5MH_09428 [Trichoderma gamsii]